MLTSLGIETVISQPQPLDWASAHNVRFDDLIHIGQGHAPVPHSFWIYHQIRPVLTLIEAAGLIGAHSSLQSTFSKLLLEGSVEFGSAAGITTAARMPRRTCVSADKNVALELGHRLIVQQAGFVRRERWMGARTFRLNLVQSFNGTSSLSPRQNVATRCKSPVADGTVITGP